jgi:chromosome segregation ATPase
MAKLLYALAVAFTLCVSGAAAKAEPYQALVQRTFDALKQSATALDRGDLGKAQALLAGIKSSAETLRGTAGQFSKQAADSAKLREAEARDVTAQITKTYAAEQAADKEVRDLEPKIADLSKQLEKANATRRELDAQAAVYQQEVRMRQECKNHFADGIFWSGECWRLSFQDLFANRWRNLNNDIEGNNRQRREIENARNGLSSQLVNQQRRVNEMRSHKAQLEAQRHRLEQQVKTLKAAVVNLTDAAAFWTDTATLIGSRITSIGTLQQSVQLLMKRASRTAAAPVFDSYEKEEVRSLEATLINFAQTLDKGTNILLKP